MLVESCQNFFLQNSQQCDVGVLCFVCHEINNDGDPLALLTNMDMAYIRPMRCAADLNVPSIVQYLARCNNFKWLPVAKIIILSLSSGSFIESIQRSFFDFGAKTLNCSGKSCRSDDSLGSAGRCAAFTLRIFFKEGVFDNFTFHYLHEQCHPGQ